LDKVRREGGFQHYNLGTGDGHSVKEVLTAIEQVLGKAVPVKAGPRRPGDPPRLVADPSKARRELGWTPQHSLKDIIETHAGWEKERIGS
jgi:UDP-glucose 4-epimerase